MARRRAPRYVAVSDTERAWAAGFFDGEGHVSCGTYSSGGRRYRRPYLSVAQNQREPLDRFQRVVGTGRVRGPYPGRGNSKPYFQFQITGRLGVQQAFMAIGPWVGTVKALGFNAALDPGCRQQTKTVRDPDTGRWASAPA